MPLVYIKAGKVNIYTGSADKLVSGIELISLLPLEAQQQAKQHSLLLESQTAEKLALEQAEHESELAADESNVSEAGR